jgi:two-component system cell cycle sensor histidine kinase/response regulator CckA
VTALSELRVLFLDDSAADAELCERALHKGGIAFVSRLAEEEREFRALLEEFVPDLVLADFAMPGFGGMQAVDIVHRWRPGVPCILVSGTLGEGLAVEALHSGATDYVLKQHLERLAPAVSRAMAEVESTRVREALENQLQQSQKMEAIGRLAGGIAHDFNNLLTAIRGFAELAANEIPPSHPAQADIDQIRQAADRAAKLTSQLLAFGRHQIVAPEIVDLALRVTELTPMLERLIGEQTTLEVRTLAEPVSVAIDPGYLGQIVVNLVLNARDAMPGGGTVVVETAAAEVSSVAAAAEIDVEPGLYAVLTVSDAGVGMDQDTLTRIFEPFFTTKAPGAGTGLGLATVYGHVRQSHGSIRVRSEPGKGTSIAVYLPRVPADTRMVEAEHTSAPARSGGETILVVEDEDSVRAVACRVLRGAGYVVLEAPNADSALEIARAHGSPLDLLFTDVVMPGGNGLDLAERLVTDQPFLHVLYASGYADDVAIGKHERACGWQYLAKPYSASDLLREVQRMLGRDGVAVEHGDREPGFDRQQSGA